MGTRDLLEWLVYFELTTALGAIFLLYAVVGTRRLLRSAYEERVALAARVLDDVIRGDDVSEAGLRKMQALPRRLQIGLFAGVATHLTGETRARVSEFGRRMNLADEAIRLCGSGHWSRRLGGVRLCTLLGAGHQIVPRLLHDRVFVVRAEAVNWCGENPKDEVIPTLVEFLANPAYVGGYTLRDALLRIGSPVLPHLGRILETHTGATVVPALDVAIGIPAPAFAPAAERLSHDELPAVRARAATLLGAVGGAEAVTRLLELLEDPDPAVQTAAVTAIGRLNVWRSAPVIGRMLRSPHWDVRSAVAIALRRLGGPGRLILQNYLGDDDAFASDMARQVLDLPPGVVEVEAWG